jgi:serine-type D-Ala-D-Ala carboxypeptidase/endopeptidase (penicillin-binding protein 4)
VVRRDRRAAGRTNGAARPGVVAAALAFLGVGAVVVGLLTEPDVRPAAARLPDEVPVTPVLSARRVPELVLRPVARRNLQTAAAPVVARAPTTSCLELTDGAAGLLEVRATEPLHPASNMKVVTAAAALDVLGADTVLTTRFAADAPPGPDGTVTGDLWMIGGGDPLLSTAAYGAMSTNGPRPSTDLAVTADRLVAAGVRRIAGSVVGDGSRYDDVRTVPEWPRRFLTQNVVGPLGGLIVNDGWTVDPDGPGPGVGTPGVAADPAQHAAEVMTALLVARGVRVDGPPLAGTAPATAVTVLDQPSLPVGGLVEEMLAFSDNTTAELLVKEMGRTAGAGTTAAGLEVMGRWLDGTGLAVEGVVLADGSGLSARNRLTCRVISGVLVDDGPDGPVAAGLARPGRPGTLDDRFTGGALRDRLRAKTGTLNDVTALAGWVTTVPGAQLAFAVVVNAPGGSVGSADTALQGQLLESVLAHPQAPAKEDVSPLPPAPPARP